VYRPHPVKGGNTHLGRRPAVKAHSDEMKNNLKTGDGAGELGGVRVLKRTRGIVEERCSARHDLKAEDRGAGTGSVRRSTTMEKSKSRSRKRLQEKGQKMANLESRRSKNLKQDQGDRGSE